MCDHNLQKLLSLFIQQTAWTPRRSGLCEGCGVCPQAPRKEDAADNQAHGEREEQDQPVPELTGRAPNSPWEQSRKASRRNYLSVLKKQKKSVGQTEGEGFPHTRNSTRTGMAVTESPACSGKRRLTIPGEIHWMAAIQSSVSQLVLNREVPQTGF